MQSCTEKGVMNMSLKPTEACSLMDKAQQIAFTNKPQVTFLAKLQRTACEKKQPLFIPEADNVIL